MQSILDALNVPEWWAENNWMVLRIGCAVLIGMCVGFERELRDKPAGLRTMILISLGACVFAMVSERVAGENVDRSRIAAQVVSGVGFLGAGAIIRGHKAIYGLTTAAGIWGIAAVGLASGFGKFNIALLSGGAVLLVLAIFQYITAYIDRARTIQKYRIATRNPEIRFRSLDPLFKEAQLKILHRNCYQDSDDYVFSIRAVGHMRQHVKLREVLLHTAGLTLRK